VRRYGRLTRATGLVLEATGLQLPLGATCVIERQENGETREVESEVVGFNGQRLFLMPLEEVEGICLAHACMRKVFLAMVCKAANSCRWAPPRPCWTAAANH
jgi:flagellar biosynthesis/type III secretory pathway ATPase